jgi:ABC-2 type transport system permease protein
VTTVVARPTPAPPADDLRRIADLTWTLAVTGWRLRFYGSFLGYLWSLARPFALFGVIYLVFSQFARLGDKVHGYAVYILFSLVLFQFFMEITSGCVQSLVARENLLRKIRFPALVIPLSIALTALFNLGMTLVAVIIFAIVSGVYPSWTWLELPALIAILLVFAGGLGMLLSVLYVRYRDVQPIWDVIAQALFYASPVLYVATMVPAKFQQAYLSNPIASVLTEMRRAIVDPSARHIWDAIGGAGVGTRRHRGALVRPGHVVLPARGAADRGEPVTETAPLTAEERAELEALRARVAALEGERDELLRRTAAAVARAQERAYWLDRWHLDLNALMARPAADRIRAAARFARTPVRMARTVKRKLLG